MSHSSVGVKARNFELSLRVKSYHGMFEIKNMENLSIMQ